jgi:hypothetical protein
MELDKIKELLKDPKEYAGALYGTLLGDANLDKPKPGNSRLRFGQANKEYAFWKASLLGLKDPTFSGNKTWSTSSPRHPMYTKLYYRLYPQGRKTVPIHAMKVITSLGLALLYFDDGDFHKEKMEVKIATMGFNEAEHIVLQKGLFDKFGLRFNYLRRKSYGGNRKAHYFYLRLKAIDTKLFMDLIRPFTPECMSYKVPTAERLQKKLWYTPKESIDSVLTNDYLFKARFLDERSLTSMSEETGLNTGTILGRCRKLEAQLLECLQQDIV